jgi:hypothetical protein
VVYISIEEPELERPHLDASLKQYKPGYEVHWVQGNLGWLPPLDHGYDDLIHPH